jgi:hypothetical protein
MQDTARLASRARKLLEQRLIAIEEDMIHMNTEEVISILTTLDSAMKSAGALLVPKGKPEEAPPEAATTEKVLSEITKGKQVR